MADNVTTLRTEGPESIKDLMAKLPAGTRKIINAVTVQFQRDLIERFPELNAGVNSAGAEGSYSTTLQIKAGKKGRFRGTLKPKVRTPGEMTEFDMHIDIDGQLSLGLPADWSDGAGEATE